MNIFKALTLQVPSYKPKHLDCREKQIKISNEQIRMHINSSKPKTYKVKRNKISQFNKNITSKVYISNRRQIISSLVHKSSSYQDVHPRLFWIVIQCDSSTTLLIVFLSSKQYISSSKKALYSSSSVGLESGSLEAGVFSES